MIEIETRKAVEVIDVTPFVEKALEDSRIESGICLVCTMHTTTGIVVNEAEPGLIQDIARLASSLVPRGAGYQHDGIDDNAHAHLQALLLGNSSVIPVEHGKLVLGTWQRVLFVELDGPRHRRLHVRAIPD
jgi:secondary thiamine-phosphate synthase enzyme